jgi:valyl-tRNA synthetase
MQPGAADQPALKQTLVEILDGILRALHPIMPFITEELWQNLWTDLGSKPAGSLMEGPYECPWTGPLATSNDMRGIALVQETVTAIRTIRSEMNVPPGKQIKVIVNLKDASTLTKNLLSLLSPHIQHLAKIGDWQYGERGESPTVGEVAADFEMFIPLEGLIDFAKERARLEKNKADIEASIKRDERTVGQPRLPNPRPRRQSGRSRNPSRSESRAQLTRITSFLHALGG